MLYLFSIKRENTLILIGMFYIFDHSLTRVTTLLTNDHRSKQQRSSVPTNNTPPLREAYIEKRNNDNRTEIEK